LPVLLSVPHSGRHYPGWLLAQARGGLRTLEPLEDPLVDRLVWRAQALGLGAVIAQAPRAAIDCNRSPKELDPAVIAVAPDGDPGPRARGGLGLVPGRTPRDGELWRRKVSRQVLELRLDEAYWPYHAAVASGLDALRQRHGAALLLDCHSMPPRGDGAAKVVLGDRHGRSCGRWLGDLARVTLEQAGFPPAFNDPYAGGWIVEHHGRPDRQVHALQVELDRGLYLDATLRRAGTRFDQVARLLETLARTLGEALRDSCSPAAIAAE
jgi:N-formylglutamate amidohydrolase